MSAQSDAFGATDTKASREGMKAWRAGIGVPEKADDYGLPVPEGKAARNAQDLGGCGLLDAGDEQLLDIGGNAFHGGALVRKMPIA